MVGNFMRHFLIIVILLSFSCKEQKKPSPFDEDDKYSMSKPGTGIIEYDPDAPPRIGMTEEEILQKYNPAKPSLHRTYIEPLTIKIKGQSVKFDLIIGYSYHRNEYIDEPRVWGYNGKEGLYLYLFFLENKLKYFTISHSIKNKNNEWIPGKYNQRDTKCKDWISTGFPNSRWVSCKYWSQRKDSIEHIGPRIQNLVDKYGDKACEKSIEDLIHYDDSCGSK
jgi:hypothetical protein